MRQKLEARDVLAAVEALNAERAEGATAPEVFARVGGSYSTVARLLKQLVKSGALGRIGNARATRYLRADGIGIVANTAAATDRVSATVGPAWSAAARRALADISRPLAAREPVTYRRAFVDGYVPNESSLLGTTLAAALMSEGSIPDRQPAGTYARKVLEQLLIDLSWASSRLEGNTYSRLATEALFAAGEPPADAEAVMLLNHKRAIEYLVDAVPIDGLTPTVVRNLHALLMQDLLPEPAGLGAIRSRIVNISGTTYVPLQLPPLLEEMLGLIVEKARQVKNPAEAAFFLWINIAYLQPFEDGNKRTSRLAANIPLLLYNQAPLAFLDVDPADYANAMIAVYEQLDPHLARELFAWTYRRSTRKYAVVMEAMGLPDPFRLRYREQLGAAVQRVVKDGMRANVAAHECNLPEADAPRFLALLTAELAALTRYNCSRYRLTSGEFERWAAGSGAQ